MNPKVSILWVNHNSSNFIELALESLTAIKEIDYPNYELIMVDNASNDGSFQTLKNFLNKSHINNKTIRLEKNTGFTGGNNTAYAARSQQSKYVAILNNDAVPKQQSLTKLVELMETDQSLGATQGVILNLHEKTIDTAGDYISELLQATSLFQENKPNSLQKPVYATSADAAYSLFNIQAINKIPDQNGNLFDNYLFGYYDDHILGLKLWNQGFKIKVFPFITAKHRRGTSFKKAHPLQTYLRTRNLLILNEISNSRYKNLIKLLCLRQLSTLFFTTITSSKTERKQRESSRLTSKAFTDGIRIGRNRCHLGEKIDLYKAPILEVQPSAALAETIVSLQLADTHLEKSLNKIANLP